MSFQLFGLPVSRGIAIGRAVLVASSRLDVAHYYVADDRRRGRDRAPARRARRGRRRARRDAARPAAEAPAELSALLDVHLMLLHDDTLTGATKQWIRERHYNAEWALSAQLEVLARQFDEMEDEYLRERKADLEQVVERLLGVLARGADGALAAGERTPSSREQSGERSAGARRQRHLAGRHAAVQGRRLPRLRHRRRRQDLAHRDRRAQHGHPGGRRRARGEPADPPGRLGRDRRRCRHRHRRSVAGGDRGIPRRSSASATRAGPGWRACAICRR